MQRISTDIEPTSTYYRKPAEDTEFVEKIAHFRLQEALPEGDTLALNTAFGTLSYLTMQENRPVLVNQQQFTDSELSILLPLLQAFPYYCPYEVLYTSFYDTEVTDEKVMRNRRKLQRAMAEGTWDIEMRSVRSTLSRTRLKARTMGLDIASILETGYILMINPRAGAVRGAGDKLTA